MNVRLLRFAAVALVTSLAACASSPDPTSSAALIVAPPFQWGTTCVEHQWSSFGSASSNTQMPVCEDTADCYDDPESEGAPPGEGETYSGYTYTTGLQFFEGTCEDPQHEVPVSCSQRQPQDDCDVCQYAKCCAYVALCEDDPNCTAVNDCVNTCASDDTCSEACLTNGDPTAVSDWQSALSCIQASCSASCP